MNIEPFRQAKPGRSSNECAGCREKAEVEIIVTNWSKLLLCSRCLEAVDRCVPSYSAAKALLELPDEELTNYGLQRTEKDTSAKWESRMTMNEDGACVIRHEGELNRRAIDARTELPALAPGYVRKSVSFTPFCDNATGKHVGFRVYIVDEQTSTSELVKPAEPDSDNPHIVG